MSEPKYTEEQIKAALAASNVKTAPSGYDIEMCSDYFFEALRKLTRKKKTA